MKKRALVISIILAINILNQYSIVEIIDTKKSPVKKQKLYYPILVTDTYIKSNQKNNILLKQNYTRYYDIPLSKELQKYTYDLVHKYKTTKFFNEKLIYAVIELESNFNPNIISSTNDYGLMQINITNHKWLSKKLGINNFLDAKDNINAGVFILHLLTRKYEYKGIHYILTAYNRGENGATNYLHSRNSSLYSRMVIKNFNSIEEIH